MKLLVNSRKFFDALLGDDDRRRFNDWFGNNRNYNSMPVIQVTLPEAKTQSQLGTIWRDFEIAGRLLHCEPSYVYYLCSRADSLQDIWLQNINGTWHFSTLSGLTKEQTSAAIPRLRDFMQELVNLEYQQYVVINWSCKANINKPDYEFTSA